MTEAVFAIPGDKDRRTGGFIYEARVLKELNRIGCATAHLQLPDSFPNPTRADMRHTLNALHAVPAHVPIILDGLVFGAIDPAGLSKIAAPVIAMVHHPLGMETGLPAQRADFLLKNEAAALRAVTHVVVPSPETARVLCREFGADPNAITVGLPGFDRPVVARQPVDPPLILSVGLLAPRKGHDVLLAALGQLPDLDWQADIVGKTHDPDYAAGLQHQVDALGMRERLRFRGQVDGAALCARFNAASVFALATRYEGYGMVLREAMFYGLPVVSCNVGAVADTVKDAAILVPADDATALATALRQVLVDDAKAIDLSERALKTSEKLPEWQDTAQVFAKVVRRCAPDAKEIV